MSDTPELTRLDLESLQQLTREQLVSLVVQQQAIIERQQVLIEQLQQEIGRLKLQQQSNSQTSSKPPSTDLIQKSEKSREKNEVSSEGKRKPGGQPGHPGKTRKGFGRVDRYEVLRHSKCPHCGGEEFLEVPVTMQRQQVARLVERPIEVVEYHRQTCQCIKCGQRVSAPPAPDVVPGQELSIGLQALLTWLGNQGHLSYEKQQELLRELALHNQVMIQAGKGIVRYFR